MKSLIVTVVSCIAFSLVACGQSTSQQPGSNAGGQLIGKWIKTSPNRDFSEPGPANMAQGTTLEFTKTGIAILAGRDSTNYHILDSDRLSMDIMGSGIVYSYKVTGDTLILFLHKEGTHPLAVTYRRGQ